MNEDVHKVIEAANREYAISWEDYEKAIKQIERLEREAKYGRALLWAVETGVGVTDHYGDEVHMDQGDLDELMNDYE